MSEKIFLLDGHYLIYRSYHAMKNAGLRDASGRPTGAIFGMLRFFLKLQRDFEPDYIVCALDSREPTFRHEFFEEYKASRPEMPEDLRTQISLIKQMLELLQIPVVLEPGYESDDLLAALVESWSAVQEKELIVVSNDKDLLQLVGGSVKLLKQRRGLTDFVLMDRDKIREKMGIVPEQVPDYLALMGDKVDNVPGVDGIGPTYAARLLEKFNSVTEMLARVEELSPRFREKIESSEEQLLESLKLVRLRTDCELDISLENSRFEPGKFNELAEFCRKLEFFSLVDEIIEITGKTPELSDELPEIEIVAPETMIAEINSVSGPLFGFLFPLVPEKKPTEIDRLNLLIGTYETIWATRIAVDEADTGCYEKLLGILKDREFYTHNLKLFYNWAFRHGFPPELLTKSFDLKLASYLLAPESQHGLAEIIQRETGSDLPDRNELEEEQLLTDWAPRMFAGLKEVVPGFKQKIREKGQNSILRELEQPLARELARMESTGIKVNAQELRKFASELEEKLEKLVEQAREIAGEQFNPDSPKQLREILFEKRGLSVQGKTGSGKPSTAADSLKKLADKDPLPAKILEYRRYKKLESTFLLPLVEAINPRTNRLHTRFNQTVTATGRLSSSNPNLQNIPVRADFGRRVRAAFVPSRDDRLFVAADYSQIELRLLAHFSSDQTLIKAFQEGLDIHTLTAAELQGKAAEEVVEEDRRIAKVVNYGIAYGLSEYGLAQDLGVDRKSAQRYIERYFERYSGVRDYIEKTVKEAEKRGYVKTILGRRRYLHEITSDDYFRRQFARRIAVNAPIQGSASDLIKKAMVELAPRLSEFDLDPLLQIHDELLLEVKISEAEKLAGTLKKVMCRALDLKVPIAVDVKIGYNWAKVSK